MTKVAHDPQEKRPMAGKEKQNEDGKTTNHFSIRLLCVHGGRISVTQGRDEDAPTMTPK